MSPDDGHGSYFQYRRLRKPERSIDDVTAFDLDFEEVLSRIDKTCTTPGRAILYHFLRTPCADEASLRARWAIVEALRADPALLKEARLALTQAGRQRIGDLAEEIWDWKASPFERHRWSFYAWMSLAGAIVAGSILLGGSAPVVILFVALANILVYARTTPYIARHSGSIFYLCSLIACGKRLIKVLKKAGLAELSGELKEAARPLRGIPKRSLFFRTGRNSSGDLGDSIMEYLRIFLLGELSAYFKVNSVFKEHHGAIEGLYEILGHIDASLSMAALIDGGSGISRASFHAGGKSIEAVDLVHPLVEDCVPNSLSMAGGIVITGMNMAGKSTFLKALGLAQALSTTLGVAFAREYRTSFLVVMTSMNCVDDLASRKSRYFVEAERMVAILGAAKGEAGILALVDEILVGTNSEDRITASIRILRRLCAGNSLAVAATHDLPIAEALCGDYASWHFSELLDGGDLRFDYLIKPGVVDKRNALAILRHLGFDEELLAQPHEESGSPSG